MERYKMFENDNQLERECQKIAIELNQYNVSFIISHDIKKQSEKGEYSDEELFQILCSIFRNEFPNWQEHNAIDELGYLLDGPCQLFTDTNNAPSFCNTITEKVDYLNERLIITYTKRNPVYWKPLVDKISKYISKRKIITVIGGEYNTQEDTVTIYINAIDHNENGFDMAQLYQTVAHELFHRIHYKKIGTIFNQTSWEATVVTEATAEYYAYTCLLRYSEWQDYARKVVDYWMKNCLCSNDPYAKAAFLKMGDEELFDEVIEISRSDMVRAYKRFVPEYARYKPEDSPAARRQEKEINTINDIQSGIENGDYTSSSFTGSYNTWPGIPGRLEYAFVGTCFYGGNDHGELFEHVAEWCVQHIIAYTGYAGRRKYPKLTIEIYTDKWDPREIEHSLNIIRSTASVIRVSIKIKLFNDNRYVDIPVLLPAPGAAADALWDDKDTVRALVKKDWRYIKKASDACRNDKEILLSVLLQDVDAFKCYASDELKNDRDIVLAAVKGNWPILQDVSEEYKNDIDVVLSAVSVNGAALQFASQSLKNNRDVVLSAISNNGRALIFASEELKDDIDIVRAAVSNDRRSISYASDRVRNELACNEAPYNGALTSDKGTGPF